MALLALVGPSVGCGLVSDDEDSAAGAIAQELADAMAAGALEGVPLTEAGDRQAFTDLIAPLDAYDAQVTIGEVSTEDGSGQATVHWRWEIGEETWSYDTAAELVDDDGWRVRWLPSTLHPKLRWEDQLQVSVEEARRGNILGADGVALVTDRPVVRYGLDKAGVRDRHEQRSAFAVAEAVGIDAKDFADRVAAAGPEAFVEGIVLRAEDAAEMVDPVFGSIPGSLAIEDKLPLALSREFAAPILGSVGPATAEIIAESGGQIDEGDDVGLSGLQARYEESLAGEDGLAVRRVGPDGSEHMLFRVAPQHGSPLRLTLDLEQQLEAERVLAGLGAEGPDSALVAIRPSTGEILVAANGPGNDGLNAATYGRYAPGSTFKVVTALALLRSGLTRDDQVACAPTTFVDGRSFKNYDDYPSSALGSITLTTAIAQSCNTALIDERHRLGEEDLTEAAAALGVGIDHDLGFPAYFGQVPAPQQETEKAANMIGQGTVLASPLTMAAVAASVRKGEVVIPHLFADHPAEEPEIPEPLTDSEAEALRAMMRAVVTDGSGAFLDDVPGELGAKTGTAEYGEPAPDGTLPTHAWMIATQGDLAVAVFVETGESGSQTAGPLLEEFLR